MKKSKSKVIEVAYRDGKKKLIAVGVLLMDSQTEIALGHNFAGEDILDMTHIKKSDISSVREVRPTEVNKLSDLPR